MIPSHPVSRTIRTASSGVLTSPFPMTGTDVFRFTSAITSQCASPVNFSERARAWTVIHRTPERSSTLATSGALVQVLSQPMRILAVTGSLTAFTTAVVTRSRRSKSVSMAAPASRAMTFRTGHP